MTAADCDLASFADTVSTSTRIEDYAFADHVEQGVLVYDAAALGEAARGEADRRRVQTELVAALRDGPGIVVLAGAYPDPSVVDAATAAFDAIIAEQRESDAGGGDHFAKPGANDRIWNALEKLAARDPAAFCDYYANDLLNLIAVAWLGPGFQVTSQVNVVRPGGVAQTAHRDYHLGFMEGDQAARYPAHAHVLTPALTLQGAVAHVDMPVESGPTLYLPHSQKYAAGYLAFHLPEFRAYFDEHRVQLPLAKGDAVFFNPALFHGAGANHAHDIERMANLLQISSAFGRAMESVDRTRVSRSILPALHAMRDRGSDTSAIDNVIACAAEGYAFPTNLDRDQPVDALVPPTQADLLREAVRGGSEVGAFDTLMKQYAQRRET